MTYPTHTLARKGALFGNPAVLIQTALERIVSHARYRRTLAELSALDDRQLADLGLNRAMLRSAAYQAVQASR